jgi:hypothetical protein
MTDDSLKQKGRPGIGGLLFLRENSSNGAKNPLKLSGEIL